MAPRSSKDPTRAPPKHTRSNSPVMARREITENYITSARNSYKSSANSTVRERRSMDPSPPPSLYRRLHTRTNNTGTSSGSKWTRHNPKSVAIASPIESDNASRWYTTSRIGGREVYVRVERVDDE